MTTTERHWRSGCARSQLYQRATVSRGRDEASRSAGISCRRPQDTGHASCVLGEAAKRVPDPMRLLAPTIAWREIAGMRDVLVHDYFGIDLAIVRNAALVLVPSLRVALQDLLGRVTASP